MLLEADARLGQINLGTRGLVPLHLHRFGVAGNRGTDKILWCRRRSLRVSGAHARQTRQQIDQDRYRLERARFSFSVSGV